MGKKGRGSKRRAATTEKGIFYADMDQERATEIGTDLDDENVEDEQDRPFVRPGQCQKGICGKEAACLPHANNTYSCICPHDKSPPTKDWRCVRITVPPTPHPIKNIRLSTEGNSTINKNKIAENGTRYNNNSSTLWSQSTDPFAGITPNYSNATLIILITSTILVVLLMGIIYMIVSWRRRKHGSCLANDKSSCTPSPSPIVLKRSLLVPERYAPNPQYSACSSSSVPVLQRELLKFLNEIGEGCFGKVFKGELHNETSDQIDIVAIKVLKESATREIEEDFFREVDIMSAFRHKHILSLLGVVLREAGFSPMMVFEYMPHGDLAEVLRAQKNISNDDSLLELTRKDLMLIAMQIANGMSYLAAQRFVHRDLACRNCLVASGPIVKIADFGMSRDVYTCDYYKIGGSRLLPVRWMSPESVMYGRFTLESDIWSYGIILWEIYSYGKQPYYGHSNEEVVKLILQGIMLIPPEDCPTLICDLMKCCWKTEPRDRIKFSDIHDKLEKRYRSNEHLDKLQDVEDDCKRVVFENELRQNSSTLSNKKLPRPPPILPLTPSIDLLDTDGYLLPKEIKEPAKYLDIQPVQD